MKTSYRELLVSELKELEAKFGEEQVRAVARNFAHEGSEAYSREVVIHLVRKYLKFSERVLFLARHRDLIIPLLFRIKNKP